MSETVISVENLTKHYRLGVIGSNTLRDDVARWWAALRQLKVRRVLEWPRFQAPFSAGLTLFCISLAWSATRWWERGLWILLGIAFAWQLAAGWRFAARHGWDVPPDMPPAPAPPAGAAPPASDDPAADRPTPTS